jgi:tight adherence protein C
LSTAILAVGLVSIFAAILITLATVGVITSERAGVGRSMAALRTMKTAPNAMRRELDQPLSERVLAPSIGTLTRIGRSLSPRGSVERMLRRLDEAGNPPTWDVDRILAFKVLVAAGLGLLGLLGLAPPILFGLNPLTVIAVTIGLAVLGFFLPNLLLYRAAVERGQRIRRELPNALDLLTVNVEAGLGFDAALAQVARNTDGPLAHEFFRVLQEMQIGLGRAEAMKALGERTNVVELRQFVMSMVQADQFGITIANVLRVQAQEMRIKRSQLVEEKAQKVPVKLLFPLIFCILPVLFIVVIGPAAVTIFHSFTGQ